MTIPNATSGFVNAGNVRLHYQEMGQGPAVIFCHGFPELSHSWVNQLPVLAKAGYRAIAMDMRGHGKSSCPALLTDYTILHSVGDVIGLMDGLAIDRAVLVGHDAGTQPVYHAALMRPDRVRAVVGLSVPFAARGPHSLLDALVGRVPPGFYMLYFQQPGVAERALESNIEQSFRRLLFANSGDWPGRTPMMMIVPDGGTILDALPEHDGPLSFMSEDDLRIYVAAYQASGFTGGLNGYRSFTRDWELTAPWANMTLPVPAAFIAGSRDTVLFFPGFRDDGMAMGPASGGPPALILEGAGHWIQRERPAEVNEALLRFLRTVSTQGHGHGSCAAITR